LNNLSATGSSPFSFVWQRDGHDYKRWEAKREKKSKVCIDMESRKDVSNPKRFFILLS
jgi:hypothetical protein